MRTYNSRSVKYLPVLTLTMAACSSAELSENEVARLTDDLERVGEAVTLMDKPGTEAASFTEAGQDIEQLGSYTVYSANSDGHAAQSREGSVQLFKNGTSLASYQVRTPFPYTRIGFQVAMSENYIVTDVQNYPTGTGAVKQALLIVGKTNGEFTSCGSIDANGNLPNCVTCTGEDIDSSCTAKAGVSIVDVPAGFDANLTFELEGNELFVATRYGGSQVVPMWHDGTKWTYSGRLNAPIPGERIGGSMAISGNRLAVSAIGPDGTSQYIYIYERANATAVWRNVVRVNSPNPTLAGFGERLDLSGNYLVTSDQSNVYFVELNAAGVGNPGSAISAGCTASTQTDRADVAISGSRVVVASTARLPLTFERGSSWKFYGGLPSGMFPDDINPDTGLPTQSSLWGAAIDGNRAAIGWRNYRGDDPSTETGAALGFDFGEYGCGSQMAVPGAGLVRARALTIDAVNAPNHSSYPETNAIDGSSGTRWRASRTSGTQFELDLGELEVLSHLQINWGSVYASDYLIQINSDPDSVPANQRTWDRLTHVTNADGGADFVVVRGNPQAFGRRIRLTLNNFGGTGDSGVAISELSAYGMASSACSSKPAVACTSPATAVAPPHVCANDCGLQDENLGCFCDAGCESFGDCCSPDGTAKGAEYFDELSAVCTDLN